MTPSVHAPVTAIAYPVLLILTIAATADSPRAEASTDEGRGLSARTLALEREVATLKTELADLKSVCEKQRQDIQAMVAAFRGRQRSRSNIYTLGIVTLQYLDTVGHFPAKLSDIWAQRLLDDKSVFLVPGDDSAPLAVPGLKVSYESAFERAGQFRLPDAVAGRLPMIWERRPFHGGRYVYFFDNKLEFVEQDAEFTFYMKALDRKIAELRIRE